MKEHLVSESQLIPHLLSTSNTNTGEDDMFDVIEALSPVAAKWKAIGTALRIRRNKLDEFESKGDVQDCLANTVAEYVRMGYDTKKHGEPTWLKIIKAVEHSAGGNNKAHAIAIAKDHLLQCEIFQQHLCHFNS